MRYSLVAAAIIGAVAATPIADYGYPVNSYAEETPSSSKPAVPATSSELSYGASSIPVPSYGASSSSVPSSSKDYSASTPASSSSQGYPTALSSSSVAYSASTPASSSSQGYPTALSSSSVAYSASTPTPSSSQGYPTAPIPTSTDELTTYTTTTVCPVTSTHGTQVVTTLTTSTVTITSCKGGCPGYSTTAVPPKPTSSKPVDQTTVVTTYEWVPCSTEVGQSGYSTIYSTYLTASYHTYTSTIYAQPPQPTKESVPSYSVGVPQYTPAPPAGPKPTKESVPSYSVDVPQYTPAPLPSQPAGPKDTCPPPVTVTKTVTANVPGYTPVAPPTNDYTTKVITVTEDHKPQTYTVTIPQGPKTTPSGPKTTSVPGGCNPAHPGSCPTPSSTKLYPTSQPSQGSSIAYSSSVPAPYPTSVKPSSSAEYPVSSPTSVKPSSSAGYVVSSSSAPAYEPYPVSSSSAQQSSYPAVSSTQATPIPTGGYGSYGY